MQIMNQTLQYAFDWTQDENELLVALKDETLENIHGSMMISDKQVIKLLQLLIRFSGSQKVLDIGTYTGYSALAMAEALPHDGFVVTLDRELQPALRLALGQRAVPCNCTAAAACRSNSAVRSPRSPPPPLSRRSPPPPLVRVRVAMRRMEAYRSYTVCAEAACGVCSNPPAPPAPAARQNSGQPQNVSAAKNHGHHKRDLNYTRRRV